MSVGELFHDTRTIVVVVVVVVVVDSKVSPRRNVDVSLMKSIVVNEVLHRRDVNRHVTLSNVCARVCSLCGRPDTRAYVHACQASKRMLYVGPFEVVSRQRRTITHNRTVRRAFVFYVSQPVIYSIRVMSVPRKLAEGVTIATDSFGSN